ncbi:MAG: extracellular solute-binding protein [Treponemataceae bacterium]
MKGYQKVLGTLVLGCVIVTAAAASGKNENQAVTKPAAQKVTILHYMGEASKNDGLAALVKEITGKNPNSSYEVEGVAYSQYTGILKTRIAADDAPDLFTGWPNQYTELIRAGQVLDLSEKPYMKRLIPWLADEARVNGKLYGFPLDIQLYGTFYNKDVFDKYGLKVPKTLDEYLAICETLMANKVYPFVRSYKNANFPWVEYTCFAYPMLCQSEATKSILWSSIAEKKTKFKDHPLFAESLRLYDKLLKYTEPGDFGMDSATGINKLASGERAMTMDGGWIVGDLYKANPKGRFGFFPTPWSNDPAKNLASTGLDDVFMVYAKTKNIEGVDKFLEGLASNANTNIWMEKAKMISSIAGAPVPKENAVQLDFSTLLTDNRTIQRSRLIEFSGEYRQKMRANIQLFAALPAEKRKDIDKFIQDLDAEFAQIK